MDNAREKLGVLAQAIHATATACAALSDYILEVEDGMRPPDGKEAAELRRGLNALRESMVSYADMDDVGTGASVASEVADRLEGLLDTVEQHREAAWMAEQAIAHGGGTGEGRTSGRTCHPAFIRREGE